MKQKNFKEIYDDIYSSVGTELEEKRKKANNKMILILGIFIISTIVVIFGTSLKSSPVFPIVLILGIIFLSIAISKSYKDYKLSFKQKLINSIVKKCNPNLKYLYKEGITSREYAESRFDSRWDRYHTEDLIEGELENGSILRMAEVHTEVEHTSTDSDGHTQTTYVTTFFGLFGTITLDINTNLDFMIKDNSKLAKFNKNRIEMESSEFEKYYDVFSKGAEVRQKSMELLTPEVIEEFVKIRNLFKKSLNVRVYNNKIYFRIWVGDIFEPPTFKSSVNFDMLYKYFLIIDVPRMIYETFIDNIIVMHGNNEDREKRTIANMTEEQRIEYEKKQEQRKTY